MIASGASERGLSDVTIATSASSRRNLAHQRALAAISIAPGAEDDDHAARPRARAPRAAPSRASRACARSRRRRRTPALVDRLEAARDAGDDRDALGDRVLVDVEQEPRRDGTEHVLDVEATSQRRLDVDPASTKRLPRAAELEPLRPDLGVVAEPEGDERRAVEVAQLVGEPPAPLGRRC